VGQERRGLNSAAVSVDLLYLALREVSRADRGVLRINSPQVTCMGQG